ncbi:Tat pathway signal protein [Haloarcula mannanilytica]|uniref:Tat pathway signal protein n=1 Tax=Haloarcula mannanilytica TaxID=2509225 RepID=A0A4C2EQ28_9EURY|nr:Dyp-type peroxidase domain-containing protein [Haloarcula mannanilytica]GCF14703.1 Tat pathway signal protein [Haloarcula mannanilytica]
MTSRRGLLLRLSTLTGAAGLSGCSSLLARQAVSPTGDLDPNPRADELPMRQHAWNDALRRDDADNELLPRHFRLYMLDLDVSPSDSAAETVELAMRTLEDAYEFNSEGLLHMLGWGTSYFDTHGSLDASPIRSPRVLSRTDDPDLQAFDAILVLASDVPSQLAAAESAMFDTRPTLAGADVQGRLGNVFSVADRRGGFIGEGLPAAHADAEGVPSTIPESAPMFSGFFSGRSGSQASEDRVTISDGPHAGGTTMHLSRLNESFDNWWELAQSERVQRMFSAEFSQEDIDRGDLPFADMVREHASEDGQVGHWEKVARARKDGEPIILRRDFNTVDGGQAGIHFLSLQAHLGDFEATRDAMNGWWLREEHEDLRDRQNNGLLEFIEVVTRANFYVPPRDKRAFPST